MNQTTADYEEMLRKKTTEEGEYFLSGHGLCAGCAEPIIVRHILQVAGPNTIVVNATGCLEVSSSGFPNTAWAVPWIHVAFENAAAVASGVDAALKALGKREGVNIIAMAGDGGTFDIGFQALSGMLERGHRVLYVVLDNEAYMNTGIQRSSATPWGASTTTTPPGKKSLGESRDKKPIAAIVAAHDVPYVATASVAFIPDLRKKVQKALSVDGPSFLHVFSPCPTGWYFPSDMTIEMARLAVETGVFVLWEVENGDFNNLRVTRKIKNRKPVIEYLKLQRRFRHIVKNPELVEKIQKMVDEKCQRYGVDAD